MEENKTKSDNISLTEIISTAIKIPGVRVNRTAFLEDCFKNEGEERLQSIWREGPVEAGVPEEEMHKIAVGIINKYTVASSAASFVAGLPGGLALAATIPADMLQFYGVALRVAQMIAYLYGEDDLWSEGVLDEEKVTNQLILYCGVMLGASGAAQTVRLMASALSKQAMKKLPKMALTKTLYFSVIQSIVKFFGGKMTKDIFAKAVAKALPVVGGVVSGGITFVSLRPMGKRLLEAFEEAKFDYTEATFEADLKTVETISGVVEKENRYSPLDEIIKAKQLLDDGVLTEEEFKHIKGKVLQSY